VLVAAVTAVSFQSLGPAKPSVKFCMTMQQRPEWYSEPCFLGIGEHSEAGRSEDFLMLGRSDKGVVLQTKLGVGLFWGLWCMHVLMRPSHTEINLQSSMSQSRPIAMLVTFEIAVLAVVQQFYVLAGHMQTVKP